MAGHWPLAAMNRTLRFGALSARHGTRAGVAEAAPS